MSEPMSSAEIEDVLSSIRRLVADEIRPTTSRLGMPDPAPGKLLLTPALRVVADAPVDLDDDTAPGDDSLAGRVATLGAATGTRDEWEAELPTGNADPVPEAGFWADADDWAEPETAEFVAFPDFKAAPAVDEAELTAPAGDVLPEPVAELSSTEPAILAAASVEPVPGWAQEAPEGESGTATDADQPVMFVPSVFRSRAENPPKEVFHSRREPFALRPEMVVPVAPRRISPVPGPFEPTVEPTDAPPAPASTAVEKPTSDAVAPEPFAIPQGDEFRELVRQIVREELQGALGERITRNVRKLVKAEIARAMSLHDLD